MKFIIAMILLFALVVILLSVRRPSGPRITTIVSRDERKDRR